MLMELSRLLSCILFLIRKYELELLKTQFRWAFIRFVLGLFTFVKFENVLRLDSVAIILIRINIFL